MLRLETNDQISYRFIHWTNTCWKLTIKTLEQCLEIIISFVLCIVFDTEQVNFVFVLENSAKVSSKKTTTSCWKKSICSDQTLEAMYLAVGYCYMVKTLIISIISLVAFWHVLGNIWWMEEFIMIYLFRKVLHGWIERFPLSFSKN